MEQEFVELLTNEIDRISQQVNELSAAVENSGFVWGLPTPAFYAILGALVSLTSAFLIEAYRERKKRKSIRAALTAEVSAIAQVIHSRNILEGLREAKDKAFPIFEIRMPEGLFSVYRNNTESLGTLPANEAIDFVMFYHYVDSFIQDASKGGVLAIGDTGYQSFERNIKFVAEALYIADRIIKR